MSRGFERLGRPKGCHIKRKLNGVSAVSCANPEEVERSVRYSKRSVRYSKKSVRYCSKYALCGKKGFRQDLPFPRAIKLGEEESSPAAEEKFSLFEEEKGLLSCENGFDVGVRVPFTVAETRIRGNKPGKILLGIGHDIRVPGFVDVEAASRVGYKKKKQPGTPFGE